MYRSIGITTVQLEIRKWWSFLISISLDISVSIFISVLPVPGDTRYRDSVELVSDHVHRLKKRYGLVPNY